MSVKLDSTSTIKNKKQKKKQDSTGMVKGGFFLGGGAFAKCTAGERDRCCHEISLVEFERPGDDLPMVSAVAHHGISLDSVPRRVL